MNDRFKQQAFLDERLDKTNELEFGNQAILDLQKIIQSRSHLDIAEESPGIKQIQAANNKENVGKSTQEISPLAGWI